ncbi:MAG: Coq4 family protein [Candidatus Binatia bacterium]
MRKRGVAARPIDLLGAWRGIRALLADPDDTAQVFRIIRALTGNSFERLYQKVMADPCGRVVLDEKRDILAILKDRESLRCLGEGTLGREYVRFLDRENIHAEGLVHASEDIEYPAIFLDERAQVLSRRLRDTHDLWHVVTGYERDIFGEVALLAFTWVQTGNHGIGFIVFVAALKLWHEGHREGFGLAWAALWRSRGAGFFPAADWEKLLAMPLAEVRKLLGVTEVPTYSPLFTPAAAAVR